MQRGNFCIARLRRYFEDLPLPHPLHLVRKLACGVFVEEFSLIKCAITGINSEKQKKQTDEIIKFKFKELLRMAAEVTEIRGMFKIGFKVGKPKFLTSIS